MQVCLTFGIPKEVVTTKGVSNNAPRNFLLWFSEIVDINHSVGKVYCIVGMLDTKKNNKQTKKSSHLLNYVQPSVLHRALSGKPGSKQYVWNMIFVTEKLYIFSQYITIGDFCLRKHCLIDGCKGEMQQQCHEFNWITSNFLESETIINFEEN